MSTLTQLPVSLLELASVPTGLDIRTTLLELRRYAQSADRLGFTRLWLAEHHNMEGIASSATSVLIGDLAANTERMRIGSGGIMLPNHPPLVVAEHFGTLAALYPDRIDLGLGRAPGTDAATSRALHRDERRAEYFPQEVAELQRLLGPDDDVDKKQTEGKGVHAYPGRDSNVPVWLLGSSMFSAQLAAQRGLPYAFAGHFAPALARDALSFYRENFQPSPTLETPHAILCLPLVLADTDDEARYLATSSQQRVLSLLYGKPLYLPPPVKDMDAIWDHASRRQVENFLALSVVGSSSTVALKLESLVQQFDVDELMFTNDIYDRDKRIHALELLRQ